MSHKTTAHMTPNQQAANMWLLHETLATARMLDIGFVDGQVRHHKERAQIWQRRYQWRTAVNNTLGILAT